MIEGQTVVADRQWIREWEGFLMFSVGYGPPLLLQATYSGLMRHLPQEKWPLRHIMGIFLEFVNNKGPTLLA